MATIRIPSSTTTDATGNTQLAPLALLTSVNELIEPAGRAYHQLTVGIKKSASSDLLSPTGSSGLDFDDAKYSKLKDLKSLDLSDYYLLLGLEDLKFNATDSDIKNAYKILQKVCHPDKAAPEDRELAEDRFKAMQRGYEILIDPTRRRGYDSSIEFDDRIPGPKDGLTDKDFFKSYGPVFERNERFSIKKPCPKLGSMASADDDVNNFYSFWTAFESWREFADLNEAKPENAGCREEKRSMERENKKKQTARKKEEMRRVFQLAEDALKKDPRIKRMKEQQDQAKNAKKNAKAESARLAAEAAAKAAADAVAAAEAAKLAEAEAVKKRQNQAKLLKSMRSYFAKYSKAAGFNDELVDTLRAKLEFEQFEEIVEAFKLDPQSAKGKELVNKYATENGTAANSTANSSDSKSSDDSKAEAAYQLKKSEEAKAASKASK